MRTATTIQTTSTMTVAAATTTSKATFSPPATIQHSPWHSSVPYLFGGIAAMLGVIAFALLILACSFWKLSGHVSNGENGDRDVEANEDKPESTVKALPAVDDRRIVVIMAGDLKPTFLATPMCSRASSSEDGDGKGAKTTKKPESADQKPKEEMGSHELATTTENRETNETETSQEQNQ